ncbi:hypothetical protein PRIPAC_92370, partial [Pristionchus pacificus]
SLVTVLVLLLCDKSAAGKHQKIPPCSNRAVCLSFSDLSCEVNGVFPNLGGKFQGYVWEDFESPHCNKHPDFFKLIAKLDIEPLDLYKWKVTAVLVETDDSDSLRKYKPEEFRFNFDGKSELTFSVPNNVENGAAQGSAKFEWSNNDNILTSEYSMDKIPFKSEDTTGPFPANSIAILGVYTFVIEANGEKLLDYVGPVVTLELNGLNYLLNDTAFPEKLNKLTECDVSEIKEVCYGSCDKIFSDPDSNSTDPAPEHAESHTAAIRETNCPSTLWFHSPADSKLWRNWKKMDGQLGCLMGWFQGKTTSGLHKIKPSMEVQCSAAEPSSMTPLAKIVIGVSCGVGGLMIVVLIVVVCVLMKRKRNREFGGNTEKKFTLRDSDSKSKAQTPVGMTKSTEREKI